MAFLSQKRFSIFIGIIILYALGFILKSTASPPKTRTLPAQQLLETGIIHRDSVSVEEVAPPPPRNTLAAPETVGDEALFQQAMRIAKEDPSSAYPWSKQLSDSSSQSQFLLFFGLALSNNNALLIKDWITELPASNEQRRLLEHLGAEWIKQDASAAFLWAAQLSNQELSKIASLEFMRAWAAHDPVIATHHALAQPPDPSQIRAIEIALDSWVQKDPRAALAEVQSWAQKDLQLRFATRLFSLQAQNDLPFLSEWLNAQSPSPFRDLGIQTLVLTIYQEDPEAAKKWASLIQDHSLKAETLQILKN